MAYVLKQEYIFFIPLIGYRGAMEQKTRLRIQETSTVRLHPEPGMTLLCTPGRRIFHKGCGGGPRYDGTDWYRTLM
jgi:hypothetical protein